MRTPTPTALHPVLQLEILKACTLRTSRFFTYNLDSRSVLDMNSTKTASLSHRLKSNLRSIVRSALIVVRGVKRRCHDVKLRPVGCGRFGGGAIRIERVLPSFC